MAVSPFEAIGFYEFNRKRNREDIPSQFNMVIIYVDDYSVGFCSCNKEGRITIVESRSLDIKSSCMDDIDMAYRNTSKREDGMFDCVIPCLDSFNTKMKMYYRSERQMNSDFKELLDLNLGCAEFDKIFSFARSRLKELLTGIEDLWSNARFDESECSIIIVGKAAVFYPITHCIKEFFTFDPFLPDDRFVSDTYSDRADKIIDVGMKEYIRRKEQEREIYLNIIRENEAQEKKKIPLLDTSEAGAQMEYLEPIFISAEDQLEFEMNSQKVLVDIPYSMDSLEYDVIGVGAFIRDNKPIVRIRRYNHQTRIHDIPVV